MVSLEPGILRIAQRPALRSGVAAGILLGSWATSPTVGAQDASATTQQAASPTPVSAEYEREVSEAVDAHELGRFDAARTHFLRAHEVYPNARTARGLGKVEFELGNYRESVRFLDEALASPERALPPDLREEVAQLRARARGYLGELKLEVVPEAALIDLDGNPVARGAHAVLTMNAGEHVLDIHAMGYLAQSRQLSLRAGEHVDLRVELLPATIAPEDIASTHIERRDAPRRLHRKWWVWTIAGAAVAGALTATLLATRQAETRTRPLPSGSEWTAEVP